MTVVTQLYWLISANELEDLIDKGHVSISNEYNVIEIQVCAKQLLHLYV